VEKLWLLKKLNTEFLHEPATPLLGRHPKELEVRDSDACTPVFVTVLYTTAEGGL
jgi:hypothetical protein